MDSMGPLVQFFGVRGSYPAVGSQFSRFGGNTAALCVKTAGRRIIFDGGLGLVDLGKTAMEDREHVIFMTHVHYDHLTGLPFFAPLFQKGNRVRVFVPAPMVEAMKVFWGPPYCPLRLTDYPARVEILPTPEGHIDLAGLLELPDRDGDPAMETLFLDKQYHPLDGVMVHRVSQHGKAVVYATDIELTTEEALSRVAGFCSDADLLICDTQYEDKEYQGHHQGWGHNSIELTARLAEMARVRDLVLFHHAPTRADSALEVLEENARRRFANARAAYEGLSIQL